MRPYYLGLINVMFGCRRKAVCVQQVPHAVHREQQPEGPHEGAWGDANRQEKRRGRAGLRRH